MSRLVRLAAVAGLLLTGLVTVPAPARAAEAPTAGQSSFVPLPPTRVLDTRSGLGAPAGRVGPAGTVDLPVAGVGAVPADATAVVLNLTGVAATAATDVRAYPTPAGSGQPPTVSNLNLTPGLTAAGLVTVQVGDGGRVRLRNNAGYVGLVADLAGYYRTGPGSTYVSTAPVRLLDTRDSTPVATVSPRRLDLTQTSTGSASGVPANATAVVLNLTAVAATASTDVRVYPAGRPPPEVSNLNTTRGRGAIANLVTVQVDGAAVDLANASGSVQLVADLAGWFVPDSSGAVFHPLAPRRLLDTRLAGGPVGPGASIALPLSGSGALPWLTGAVALTVTATQPTAATDIRVYPQPVDGGGPPEVSNLNLVAGQTVPNAVVVQVGPQGLVRLRNNSGTVHLVVDLAGYYAPPGDGYDLGSPQCRSDGTSDHPADPGAFVVVGVNAGKPFGANPCLADELTFARGPGEPAVYLNTANPGPSSPHWPAGDCAGDASARCTALYGEAAARDAVGVDAAAYPRPAGAPALFVWLDVENANSWTGTNAQNLAVLQGMVRQLLASGQAYAVGFYSTTTQWREILGTTGQFPTLQSWVADRTAAPNPAKCAASFTGGPVVLVQYQATVAGREYDRDRLC